jgi:hypothetical protein
MDEEEEDDEDDEDDDEDNSGAAAATAALLAPSSSSAAAAAAAIDAFVAGLSSSSAAASTTPVPPPLLAVNTSPASSGPTPPPSPSSATAPSSTPSALPAPAPCLPRARRLHRQYYARRQWAGMLSRPEMMTAVPPDLNGAFGGAGAADGFGGVAGFAAGEDSPGWLVVPRPRVGTPCLIIACGGATVARDADGQVVARFLSALPGGSPASSRRAGPGRRGTGGGGRGGGSGGGGAADGESTVLEGVFVAGAPPRVVITDVLSWAGFVVTDSGYDFRRFWLDTKLQEFGFDGGDARGISAVYGAGTGAGDGMSVEGDGGATPSVPAAAAAALRRLPVNEAVFELAPAFECDSEGLLAASRVRFGGATAASSLAAAAAAPSANPYTLHPSTAGPGSAAVGPASPLPSPPSLLFVLKAGQHEGGVNPLALLWHATALSPPPPAAAAAVAAPPPSALVEGVVELVASLDLCTSDGVAVGRVPLPAAQAAGLGVGELLRVRYTATSEEPFAGGVTAGKVSATLVGAALVGRVEEGGGVGAGGGGTAAAAAAAGPRLHADAWSDLVWRERERDGRCPTFSDILAASQRRM